MNLKSLYQNNNFIVYQSQDGYIIQNIDMDGFSHSHIKNYKTCIWIIDLLINKKCPLNIPKYLLISLIRLTDDKKYLKNLNSLLEQKNNKKYYFNSNKGLRKK